MNTSENKPFFMRWEIHPSINFKTGDITLTTHQEDMRGIMQQVHAQIMRTQEEATRKALIALGWTPPGEPRQCPSC